MTAGQVFVSVAFAVAVLSYVGPRVWRWLMDALDGAAREIR